MRAFAALLLISACAKHPLYQPQTRALTLTAVPLLTKELKSIYPFLVSDFGRGGVLEGKEVYAFVPTNLTVVEGDTVNFTLINPEDDVHSFVLGPLKIAMPPQSTVNADYVARRAGVFRYYCNIPTHTPMMYGQLVVLPAR